MQPDTQAQVTVVSFIYLVMAAERLLRVHEYLRYYFDVGFSSHQSVEVTFASHWMLDHSAGILPRPEAATREDEWK